MEFSSKIDLMGSRFVGFESIFYNFDGVLSIVRSVPCPKGAQMQKVLRFARVHTVPVINNPVPSLGRSRFFKKAHNSYCVIPFPKCTLSSQNALLTLRPFLSIDFRRFWPVFLVRFSKRTPQFMAGNYK